MPKYEILSKSPNIPKVIDNMMEGKDQIPKGAFHLDIVKQEEGRWILYLMPIDVKTAMAFDATKGFIIRIMKRQFKKADPKCQIKELE